jgi:hypothetical protein
VADPCLARSKLESDDAKSVTVSGDMRTNQFLNEFRSRHITIVIVSRGLADACCAFFESR